MSASIEELKQFKKEHNALTDPGSQRVVCAAVKMTDGVVFVGVRHFCPTMRMMIKLAGYDKEKLAGSEQGFIDNFHNFLTRQEAFIIAERQGQYMPYEPFTPGTLYSEDLY